MTLHIRQWCIVKTNVTRVALWVSLACLQVQAADVDLQALLKGIEQRYNRAKTLQVQFTESYSVGGQARKSESGALTLRKPGRMRWDYTDASRQAVSFRRQRCLSLHARRPPRGEEPS